MSRQIPNAQFNKPKTLDNKYMLGDEIGKGAYARVYKALDLDNGDFVAIKQVSLENICQEDLNTIMQEIDLLKNLNHKNIVKYLGSLKTKTHLHIILEYAENGSLANIIKPNKFGPFPESLVALYISQVLEGLVYLHEQGVIHRDIKGANILITKEGLVKLADFGVATKLNEADVNTHSVVGTPYWMAPEVIEMSGVCAASDIWSVGCTVIELLTCVPPYFDLQPMPALFRIVQDEHPPIPDSLSPDITDFLRQCFKKDARQRPDAKAMLSHPWIQNYRRVLQSSLRQSGTVRKTRDDLDTGSRDEDNQRDSRTNADEEIEEIISELGSASVKEERANHEAGTSTSNDYRSPKSELVEKITSDIKDDVSYDQLAEKSNLYEALIDGEVGHSELRSKNVAKDGGRGGALKYVESSSVGFGTKSQDSNYTKSPNMSTAGGANEISKFSDTPGDASLDDLFQPVDKTMDNRPPEASSSRSTAHVYNNSGHATDVKIDLATKLRATIAQKRMEKEMGRSNSGGHLLRLMIKAWKDEVIDIDGLGIIDKLPAEHLFPLQAAEFGRLIGSLRPDVPEEAIVSASEKLLAIFHQRPEQKLVFVSQHGLLPLMELLEVPNLSSSRVICSVLQIINQLIKDKNDLQENACLIGLIPLVMSFAVPDRPCEVRMEAANFFQQLCQSSSLTLQMFIASRGIPVLVGFLEADYAKYREMVHLAIDGMWQVFKLQRSTLRNEFCRIAAKNGILPRLINTLYSLNEATLLASSRGGTGFSAEGSSPRPISGPLDPNDPRCLSEDMDRPQSSNSVLHDAEFDLKQKRNATSASRLSTDAKLNRLPSSCGQEEQVVRPLLSLLDKEPPSRRFSGQLEYARQLSGLGRHGDPEYTPRSPVKAAAHKMGAQVSDTSSSQTNSGALSGSGVLNGTSGSAASSGLLSLHTLSADVAKEYLEKVADLILEFAQANSSVKAHMCGHGLLLRLFQMFGRIEQPILFKILKCINHLSTDPNCLESLQRAEAIKYLIPNLDLKDGPLISEIHHEVLSALFNLCKINKRRQEQAAENGMIPHLMQIILTDSSPFLKQYALPLLCDMAHASRNSREQIRAHGGLDVYLRLLDDEAWAVTCLDSIAVCLAHDNDHHKVEQALLKKEAIHKLVNFFQCCPEQHFVHILEPFLKIITKSSRINTTLAVNGLTPLLIARLDHRDAIARLNLLKLIKAVYEQHPRPKQLIVENNLPQKLHNLIEERRDGQSSGGQVLVKQMATSLLKALHINTVL